MSAQRPHLTTSHSCPPGSPVISISRGSCKSPLFDPSSFTSSISALAASSSSDSNDSSSHQSCNSDSDYNNSASSPSTTPSTPVLSSDMRCLQVTTQHSVHTVHEEFSPIQREKRAPVPSHSPLYHVETSPSTHTFNVQLPKYIEHEMVTISVHKGDRIRISADAWNMEADCKSDTRSSNMAKLILFIGHYQWEIYSACHDIDMTGVHAMFDSDGVLAIDVRRRRRSHYHHV